MNLLAYAGLLFSLAGPIGGAQVPTQAKPAASAMAVVEALSQDSTEKEPAQENSAGVASKHTRLLGELQPVVQWRGGAVLAAVLAMIGALVLVLPVAVAYKKAKPVEDYDANVTHSSIILAPAVAAILIVVQGSLAMAFSLAGVATAVRFRNALRDTDDAVYLFVAIAIGMAAGGQALHVALAISVSFSLMLLLLSKSPFRMTNRPGGHHRHHDEDWGEPQHNGSQPAASQPEAGGGNGRAPVEYLTIRTREAAPTRRSVEHLLQSSTKHWRLERTAPADGALTLVYSVRRRKRTPRQQLLTELAALGGDRFSVDLTSASME